MSLDVANKTNIDLQKVVKKQSLQLTELQAHYDDVQRQLQQTLDQYGVAQRRVQSLSAEMEEVRANYENALRSKRNVELTLEDAQTRINELSVINVNLASTKSKLEVEISQVAQDYEEVTRELRISDERFQKVQVSGSPSIEALIVRALHSSPHTFTFAILPHRSSSSTPSKSCTKNKSGLLKSRRSRSRWRLKSR